jgi:hypothetical protein
MELNDGCSPGLLNVRHQNDFARDRYEDDDGVADWRPALSRISNQFFGGADRDRTGDLLLAKQALSQLSYSP